MPHSPLSLLADIVVGPTPPSPLVSHSLEGSGLAVGCFWTLSVLAAVMLWRLRRRRNAEKRRDDSKQSVLRS